MRAARTRFSAVRFPLVVHFQCAHCALAQSSCPLICECWRWCDSSWQQQYQQQQQQQRTKYWLRVVILCYRTGVARKMYEKLEVDSCDCQRGETHDEWRKIIIQFYLIRLRHSPLCGSVHVWLYYGIMEAMNILFFFSKRGRLRMDGCNASRRQQPINNIGNVSVHVCVLPRDATSLSC